MAYAMNHSRIGSNLHCMGLCLGFGDRIVELFDQRGAGWPVDFAATTFPGAVRTIDDTTSTFSFEYIQRRLKT